MKNLSDEEVRSLAHELQVHRIELEMQNEELHKAQVQVEALLRKSGRAGVVKPLAELRSPIQSLIG